METPNTVLTTVNTKNSLFACGHPVELNEQKKLLFSIKPNNSRLTTTTLRSVNSGLLGVNGSVNITFELRVLKGNSFECDFRHW